MENTFELLAAIPVRDKVEQKNGLDYLSWANAWALLMRHYPDSKRTVYESANGLNYFTDGAYAYVKVGITVNGIEHIDYLPVLDHRNRAIPLENMNSFDVNKAIQRSTAKAIAMHGLGLSLWTGEDIPETVADTTPEKPLEAAERTRLEIGTDAWERVRSYVERNPTMSSDDIVAQLRRKYVVGRDAKAAIDELINGRTDG